MYADARTLRERPPRVDFASHAASLGCAVLSVPDGGDVRAAYRQAREHARAGRVAVVVIRTHPSSWTDAGAWWEVGVPERSVYPAVTDARLTSDKAKSDQVRYLGHP
jgi:3D-(3,5/4)-trihydroxycyclohexane-1,2-dione acylhydrolase (decyclizing)